MATKSNIRIAENLSRTATETFQVDDNNLGNGVFIVNTVSGAGAGDTVTITIDGYDFASKSWYNILTGNAITTNAKTIYRVGDITPAAANTSVEDFLPEKFRVVATKNTATAIVFSIGANLSD